MTFAKRFILFAVLNLLAIVVLSGVVRLLGFDRWLTAKGMPYQALMVICLVWGMGGALISLTLSRIMVYVFSENGREKKKDSVVMSR